MADEDLDVLVERYSVLCNLIETIWEKRLDDDYYNIDVDNLPEPRMTSPQARKIATFIESLFSKNALEKLALELIKHKPEELRRYLKILETEKDNTRRSVE